MERTKDRFASKVKVANRSFLVAESSPGASEAKHQRGRFPCTGGIPKGGSPWRAFGDFPRDGKVTRGGGAERPPHGGRGGRRPPLGECRGAKPLALRDSSPGSEGRSALLWVERRGGRQPSSQGSPGAPTRPSAENKGVVSRRGLTSPECTAPQCCGQRRCPPASASPHIRRAQR